MDAKDETTIDVAGSTVDKTIAVVSSNNVTVEPTPSVLWLRRACAASALGTVVVVVEV